MSRRHFWTRFSITARLILGLTIGTTVLWCGATAFSTLVSYRALNEAFDGALRETGRRLLPLAVDDVGGHESDDASAIHHFLEGRTSYLSYQLRDASGRVLLRTHDAPELAREDTDTPGFGTVRGHRLFTETDDRTGLTITIAETTSGRHAAIIGSVRALLWPLLILIPLNMLAIWLVVRGAMRPVLRLSRDIATRGGGNLAELDISDQPRELKPIAEAVADLLRRLRAALDAERAFAANSAHELRTPIAGALAQTQRLVAELGDAKDRRRARDMEATLKRLSRLAEKLLQLSRADAGVGLSDTETDLLPVLDIVVEDCARLLEDPSRVHYRRPAGTKLEARMDIDAFAIAMRNLIDNAANHGTADGQVEVTVEPGGVISVVNEGPTVAPDILARLTQRFARGDTDHGGSGLGLSIVETILSQVGGRLELRSPATGRKDGFEARVVLVSPKA